MRVADFIAQLLVDDGIEQVFMVTGGGAMHLNDALAGSGLDDPASVEELPRHVAALRASGAKRGTLLRKSLPVKVVLVS